MRRFVGLVMTLIALHASDALAGHLVQLDAIAFFEKTSTKKLLGYLAKPDGAGPFPAVVVLHGCTGFFSGTSVVADRLSSWGFVALAVDSLRPRDRDDACSSGSRDQPIDAYAGLTYLAAQSFVDPDASARWDIRWVAARPCRPSSAGSLSRRSRGSSAPS